MTMGGLISLIRDLGFKKIHQHEGEWFETTSFNRKTGHNHAEQITIDNSLNGSTWSVFIHSKRVCQNHQRGEANADAYPK